MISDRHYSAPIILPLLLPSCAVALGASGSRNQPLAQISELTERSLDGVKSLLSRIRKSLGQCIENKLAAEA